MDTVKDPDADLNTHNLKTRTPAYANFDVNTDKLSHLLDFVRRGTEHFVDELKNSVVPAIRLLSIELTDLQGHGRPVLSYSSIFNCAVWP